jgi:hypothetical protein
MAVDTSALLALANPRDQYHRQASEALARARANGVTWVSTMLVLAELHGHLLRYLSPTRAREIIQALSVDETFDWLAVTDQLVKAALDSWMTRFSDQSISLTDAVTFEVMQKERIAVAFAFDKHFIVAGYRLLT